MKTFDIFFLSEFNYTFKWVEDGNYGFKNKETGEWNGLMGELQTLVVGAGGGAFSIFSDKDLTRV